MGLLPWLKKKLKQINVFDHGTNIGVGSPKAFKELYLKPIASEPCIKIVEKN